MDRATFLELIEGEVFLNGSKTRPETSGNAFYHWLNYAWAMEVIRQCGRSGLALDVASGSGHGTSMLANTKGVESVIGIDISERNVRVAQEAYPDIQFLVGSAETLTDLLPAGSARFMVCMQTIEHLMSPAGFLSSAARVLAGDGLLLMTTPTHNAGPVFLPENNPYHVCEFGRQQLRELVGVFFEEVHFLDSAPEAEFVLSEVAAFNDNINVPQANYVYAARPRTQLEASVTRALDERFRLDVLSGIQGRAIARRIDNHFLRDSYHFLEFIEGFYVPETGQVWTDGRAVLSLIAESDDNCLFTFKCYPASTATPESPVTVTFRSAGHSSTATFEARMAQEIAIPTTDRETKIVIECSSTYRPSDDGKLDSRRLGIALYDFHRDCLQ